MLFDAMLGQAAQAQAATEGSGAGAVTSRVVTFAQIECDNCGARRDDVDQDATVARIGASRDGWKYIAFNIRGKGLQKKVPDEDVRGYPRYKVNTVPRQWDCCPECPLPESATEAAQIRDRRKVQDAHGKWIDRESA